MGVPVPLPRRANDVARRRVRDHRALWVLRRLFFVALTLVAVILAVITALITSIVGLILPRAVMDHMRSAVRYGVDHGLGPVLKVFTSVFRLLGVNSTLAIGIAFYVYLSVYALARTAILVLSLASLRKLPSSALQTVDWVTLIPHI